MGVNGVSHHVVDDDLEGATAVLHWLSTMPPTLGVPPAVLPSSDPLDRGIGYAPLPGMYPKDPWCCFPASFQTASCRLLIGSS